MSYFDRIANLLGCSQQIKSLLKPSQQQNWYALDFYLFHKCFTVYIYIQAVVSVFLLGFHIYYCGFKSIFYSLHCQDDWNKIYNSGKITFLLNSTEQVCEKVPETQW